MHCVPDYSQLPITNHHLERLNIMHNTSLDRLSPYHVEIPPITESPMLIAAGETFVTYEETLPPEQQSTLLPDIKQHLDLCIPSKQHIKSSEAQRTVASETVKRLDEQATDLIRKIHRMFGHEFYETPDAAENWGFEVKQTTGNILMPKSRTERLDLLDAYILKEESRPEKERFTKPELAMVINLRNELKANLVARRNSRRRRKSSQSTRMTALRKLYDCLRVAASVIIIKHFDQAISPEMGNWGYEVVKRQSTEKEVETAPASNGSDASSTNGTETTSTNGAANSDTTVSADAATNGQVDLDGAVEGVVEASD